jgi:prepilin-type N-terminal cleavage/methylation domain-containing protein
MWQRRKKAFTLVELPAVSKRAFTLVELLVVVGIIAVLVAILLPALNRARRQAQNVACASNMHQCLLAVLMYNTSTRGGLANYMPGCPFWGAGFLSSDPAGVQHINYLAQDHLWKEGRSGNNYWRGYLLDSGAAKTPRILGCTAHDYTGEAFFSSYNGPGAGCVNHVETVAASAAFRQNPAYLWYGPGCTNEFDNVAIYNGGNITGPPGNYKKRSVLMTCPQPFVAFVAGGNKVFDVPHHPEWGVGNFGGGMTPLPYSENVGYSDGSVRFFENARGGTFNPN